MLIAKIEGMLTLDFSLLHDKSTSSSLQSEGSYGMFILPGLGMSTSSFFHSKVCWYL